jgi:hypothetical protein
MSREYDATALFTFPKPKHDVAESHGLMIYGRPSLFQDIRENHGVDVHVSRGLDSIVAEADTVNNVVRPEYRRDLSEVSLQRMGDVVLSSYGLIRPNGKPLETDHLVQALNPMNLRKLARDKFEVGQSILEPLGLYRKSLFIPKGISELSADDLALASKLVLKPNGGFASRGIESGTPTEIATILQEEGREDRILEERLDFSLALPSLRGSDEYQQHRLDEANRLGVNKELRLYSYGMRDWQAVARIAEPGELKLRDDEWLYVEEGSVPAEAIQWADRVKDVVDEQIGASDTLLAVDMVYVRSESRPDPHWEVMEVNAEPFTLRPEVNGTVGLKHRGLLAAQIGRIAKKNK